MWKLPVLGNSPFYKERLFLSGQKSFSERERGAGNRWDEILCLEKYKCSLPSLNTNVNNSFDTLFFTKRCHIFSGEYGQNVNKHHVSYMKLFWKKRVVLVWPMWWQRAITCNNHWLCTVPLWSQRCRVLSATICLHLTPPKACLNAK